MQQTKKYAKIWAIWVILAPWMPGCATQPSPPMTCSCAAPEVTRCRPPERPAGLSTQADLLSAYVDALSAWAACNAQIEALIDYYEKMGRVE